MCKCCGSNEAVGKIFENESLCRLCIEWVFAAFGLEVALG